jgi:ATP-dependent Lon protease
MSDMPELLKTEMKLYFVEQMDEVLQIALEEKLPELKEEPLEVLAGAMPPMIPATQPIAPQ